MNIFKMQFGRDRAKAGRKQVQLLENRRSTAAVRRVELSNVIKRDNYGNSSQPRVS